MQVGFLHIRVNKAAMVAKLLACSFPGRLIKTKYNVLCNLYSGVRTRIWLARETYTPREYPEQPIATFHRYSRVVRVAQ